MKVGNARSAVAPGRAAGGGPAAASGDGFARALAGASATGTGAAAGPSGAAAVAGVLALQEVETATGREARRRALRRGEMLLDELDRLRLAILAGAVDPERLAVLATTLRDRPDAVDDPELAGILDEIELRVAVELAKCRR